MMEAMIKELEAYALENYEKGGHWVFETHGKEDYMEVITTCEGNIKKAKALLRDYWRLMEEQRKNTMW